MSSGVLEASTDWAASVGLLATKDYGDSEVVFHGGEPLTAGVAFYRQALPRMRGRFRPRLHLSMQTNLWLLTDEMCELFAEYGVSLGTSLDGPEEITDAQRGEGYYRRTMTGVERASRWGLSVGCICTFTRYSAARAGEIFDFFIGEGLDFAIHAAVTPLRSPERGWSLLPEAYGEVLVAVLNRYLDRLGRVRISTLDALSHSVSAGESGLCTFRDCLGNYLAVAPDGGIYPCQRFAGQGAFRLGYVGEMPDAKALAASPAWRLLYEREERVQEECGDCPHFAYCKGGCPYDALAAGGGEFRTLRDPYCEAYQRIFSYITDRALEEVFSDENLQEVARNPDEATFLRRGPLISLMRGDVRPGDSRPARRRTFTAVTGDV